MTVTPVTTPSPIPNFVTLPQGAGGPIPLSLWEWRRPPSRAGTTSSKFPFLPKELWISDGLAGDFVLGQKGRSCRPFCPGVSEAHQLRKFAACDHHQLKIPWLVVKTLNYAHGCHNTQALCKRNWVRPRIFTSPGFLVVSLKLYKTTTLSCGNEFKVVSLAGFFGLD